MITDEMIERLLAEAAELYEPPNDGAERVLGAATPASTPKPHRGEAWRRHRGAVLSAAAAIVLITAAVASALSGGTGGGGVKGGPALSSRLSAPSVMQHGAANATGGTSATSLGSAAGSAGAMGAAPGAVPQPLASQPSVALPKVGTGDSARVVKTGDADIEVDKNKVVPALNALASIAGRYGGYVLSSQTDEGGNTPSGSVSLRIPEPRFDQAVIEVRRLGTVDSLSTHASDVTAQYTDLQARVHALSATLNTFETLLSRANTIGEVLAVQSQITGVQTQIDQTEGQIKLLNSQSTYGTFNVTVHAKGAPPVVFATHHNKSGLHRAFNDSVDGFLGGIEFILAGLGPALVFLLAVAGAFFVGRFAYGVLRRRLV